jgi:hypothetical protein
MRTVGMVWSNNSCAFDSLGTVLYNIWRMNMLTWTIILEGHNNMRPLLRAFETHLVTGTGLETHRDNWRRHLASMSNLFPWGEYVDVASVAEAILTVNRPVIESVNICSNGHNQHNPRHSTQNCFRIIRHTGIPVTSTGELITNIRSPSARRCETCNNALIRKYNFMEIPNIIGVEMNQRDGLPLEISKTARVTIGQAQHTYILRGVIYFGSDHFTSIFVDEINEAWYHDGIVTGQRLVNLGHVDDVRNLRMNNNRRAMYVIYCHEGIEQTNL